MNIKDMNSGSPVDLKGDALEEFEEALKQQVEAEVEDAEEYLDEDIRPRITENWQYYRRELPAKRKGEASYTDNTCQATVDHYVAHSQDAFTSDNTLEVVPDGVTDPFAVRVINQVINSVLDTENDRYSLYQSFFKDCFVSGASIMKPFVTEEVKIEKEFFTDIPDDAVEIHHMELEESGEYERVELVITEEKVIEESVTAPQPMLDPANPDVSIVAQNGPEAVVATPLVEEVTKITLQSGYFALVTNVKTIKIEQVPAENFLINRDAKSIRDARFVGHKAMVTISELLAMGFNYDDVYDVYENCGGDDDADTNEASMSRKRNIIGDDLDVTSVDNSQKEVELYEVYIKSSVAETLNEEDKVAVSKLYQVFYTESTLLDYQEVDFIPYVGTSPNPVPHMFWGEGMVDSTKHIQTAKSGLLRQQFANNDLVNRPRIMFNPQYVKNPRDLFNTAPGAAVACDDIGQAVAPLQLGALAGDSLGMSAMLDGQRESGTGMSFTGQGMLGEVLKAGGSTISAQMVLSEGQMVQKNVIKTLLEGGVKPLLKSIYNLMRENFSEWEVTVDGNTINVNPNQWPALREVRIKTPLGSGAKLEKAQGYMSLYQTLTTAQGEAGKLVNASKLRGILTSAFEYQDIMDAGEYLNTVEDIQAKDEITVMIEQLKQDMQKTKDLANEQAVKLAELTQRNQVLEVTASQMAQAELQLKERELAMREDAQRSEIAQKADEQQRKQEETDAKLAQMADATFLREKEIDLKYDTDETLI